MTSHPFNLIRWTPRASLGNATKQISPCPYYQLSKLFQNCNRHMFLQAQDGMISTLAVLWWSLSVIIGSKRILWLASVKEVDQFRRPDKDVMLRSLTVWHQHVVCPRISIGTRCTVSQQSTMIWIKGCSICSTSRKCRCWGGWLLRWCLPWILMRTQQNSGNAFDWDCMRTLCTR